MTNLSPREREVMQLVADGLTHERIGGEMGVTRRTVSSYISSAMRKLDARSCASAVAMLVSRGMIVAPNKGIENGANS